MHAADPVILPAFRQMLTWAGSHPWWFSTTGTSHNPLRFYFFLFIFFGFISFFFMRARQDSHPLPLTALQHFIWKANFLWWMWEITIHYLHLHSLPLHNAGKSTIHSTPVHFRDTCSCDPGRSSGRGLRIWYLRDVFLLLFSFFFLYHISLIILTWALGVRIVNVLSQPHRYHLK